MRPWEFQKRRERKTSYESEKNEVHTNESELRYKCEMSERRGMEDEMRLFIYI